MNRRSLTLHLIGLLCLSSPAWAQAPRATGPFTGLFGGRSQATHTLDFRGSLFAAQQKVLVPSDATDDPLLTDPRFQESNTYGGTAGTLTYGYGRHGGTSSFSVNGRGSVSDYTVAPGNPDVSFSAGTGLSTRLTRKIDFGTSASVAYSPFFSFLTSASPNTPAFDPTFGIPSVGFAASGDRNITFDGNLGITSNFTKRSSLAVSGNWREMHLFHSTSNDVLTYGAHATFSHRLARTLGFHVGYGRDVTRYVGTTLEPTRSDSYDVGLDYGDGFTVPLGRRASLTFGSSASVVNSRGGTYFRVNGNAALARALGRTWSASIAYNRSMNFVAAFTEPVLSDSVFGSFGGLLAPRLSWTSGAGLSRGQVGFTATEHFTTYSASSGVTYGLWRSVGLYGHRAITAIESRQDRPR